MNKYLLAAFALAAVLSGCVKDDLTNGQDATVVMNAPVFYAGFADASSETKTYVNENGHLRWNADDRLTIFVGKTLNTQYAFDGEDGDNAGGFNPISDGGGFVTANPLNANYAVYPYSSSTKISEEGVISLSLPEVQAYGENSFGRGANTMVAVTENKDDYYLPFKNVCGYLVVSFYGDATITSVSLKGNNGEKLAGAATVTPSFGGNPSLVMKDTATETITIDCGEGIEIGTTKEIATAFWFVVPQTTFSNGITITATSSDGAGFQKATSKTIAIERNKISTMAALEAAFTSEPPVPEAVDLSLPSGIKWASFNLGASKPEDFGGYYQWGGLEDVTNTSIYLDYSNCPYHIGSSSSSGWTKYVLPDNSSYYLGDGYLDTVLEPEDDVAHVKLGGNWRMPTEAEFQELKDNCTVEKTDLNGVPGMKFTSNKNGNSIFLPIAGYRVYDELRSGTYGNYWASTRHIGFPFGGDTSSYALQIRLNGSILQLYRYYGNSVRPVSDEDVIRVTGISLSKSSITLAEESSEYITATVSPSNAHNQDVFWSSSNPDIAMVEATGLITAIKPGEAIITAKSRDGSTATCEVTVISGPAEPEMVDLGLSVKWASCNLGALKPEEYGGYYQWGGRQDIISVFADCYSGYYRITSNGYTYWTKYVPSNKPSYWSGEGSPDNKNILEPEDDVAHVKLGGNWRMPTSEECKELIDNCTSEWTTLNRVYGRKFTSNKNGNSIFLPAAGYRFSYADPRDVGIWGCYRSSSLYTGDPDYALLLSFNSDNMNALSFSDRADGMSVRPVSDEFAFRVTGISLNMSSITLAEGNSGTLTATISPLNVYDKNVAWSSNNPDIATVDAKGVITAIKQGKAIVTAKSQDGGYTATCEVSVIAVPEAVDLGLTSGIKWASFNIGASKPEEFGGYYQWGGLEDVTDTSIFLYWDNCPYHTGSDFKTGWTKYIPSIRSSYWLIRSLDSYSPDNKTVLEPEDDIAHMSLGGNWRMPTEAEFQELKDNCTVEKTDLNGVPGMKFTSNKNGNSIFLPAAGYRTDVRLGSVGSFSGIYWSSSLNTNYPYLACHLYFGSDGFSTFHGDYRYLGQSVRPVCE